MGGGAEPIVDPRQLRSIRRQARRVHLLTFGSAAAATAALMLPN